ncbi:MAG: hypothetical protein NTZ32_11545 [Planctomycetales bacterium]|nr:hypothetical protein [Planctomycetales bacterium]
MNIRVKWKICLASWLVVGGASVGHAVAADGTQKPELVMAAKQSGTVSPVAPQNTTAGPEGLSGPAPKILTPYGELKKGTEAASSASAAGGPENPAPPLPKSTTSAQAPEITQSFEGIGATKWVPADPILAVGAQRVVQVVNSSIKITDRYGAIPAGGDQTTLNDCFGTPISGRSHFDPLIHFDHFTGRFVYLGLVRNAAADQGYYVMAVSKDAFPTTSGDSWFIYYLRNDIDFPDTDTPYWGDYPKLGFDSGYFYITTNQFNSSDSFQYAKIRIYEKANFYNGQSVSGYEFSNVKDAANVKAFTICPATTYGYPGTEYLTSCQYGNGDYVTVYKIATNSLSMSKVKIRVTAYSNPPSAMQKGSTSLIATGDDRLMGAVYQGGRLYTSHCVANGSAACSAAIKGFNTLNNTKTLDVRYNTPGWFYSYPAITVGSNGHVGMVFSYSSSTAYGSIAYTQLNTSTKLFQPAGTLKSGVGPYTQFRWGDYNGICRDVTSTNAFWMNAMYAAINNNWGTYVGSTTLTASGPVLPGVQVAYDTHKQAVVLIGDDTANSVTMNQTGNQLTVTGSDGTLVNGKKSATMTVPARFGIHADFAGGNDKLSIVGVTASTSDFWMGDGDDHVSLLLSRVKNLKVEGGTGFDSVVTTSSKVGQTQQNDVP